MTYQFVAGDGSIFPLDGQQGIRHLVGSTGLDAPPVDVTLEAYLSHDGEARTHARHPGRTILLPLMFDDELVRRDFVPSVVRTATGTPGQIVHTVSGRTLLDVVYVGGLEGDDSRAMRLVDQWRKAVVELRALDPYWYGPELVVDLAINAETTMDAAVPMDEQIPMDGGAWFDLLIAGDVPPDGYVTLTGGGDLGMTRYTFGDLTGQWTLRNQLGTSQSVIVDSRPQSFGPRKPGGSTDWSLLNEVSSVHGIASDYRVVIGATASVGSMATFTYRPRYLAAV